MIIGLVNSLELTPIAESMRKTDISNIKTVCSVKMRRHPQAQVKCVQKI